MSFTEVVYEEATDNRRRDLAPYREVFDNLVPGKQATLTVDKGDAIWRKLTDDLDRPILDDEGNEQWEDTGRGKIERGHEIAFRDVAKERGVGLTVGYQHFGDKTRLRLIVKPKREQSEEQMAKRQEGAAQKRYEKAVRKAIEIDGLSAAEAEKKVKADMQAKAKAAQERAKKQAALAARVGKAQSDGTPATQNVAPSAPTPEQAKRPNGSNTPVASATRK